MIFYTGFIYLFTTDKKDIIQNDLRTIARYLRIYDRKTANLVRDIDIIIKSYTNGENIFSTEKDTINNVWDTITDQTETLLAHNEQYRRIAEFLRDINPYKDELMLYLGANVPKSYLVILQNSSEKRPNGWFFWSFAYVRVLQGRIRTIHMIDSYLGYKTMPWIMMNLPSWSYPIYQWVPFGRIASNKFWFTNIDGDNMITLYNNTFSNPESDKYIPPEICQDICHRPIDGVIFVQTNGLKKLVPGLTKKSRERQFMNATVDLRRGEDLPNKKEYYLTDSQNFFLEQDETIVKNFLNQFTAITDNYTFGIYIPTISAWLNEVLTKYNFTTIPNNHTIYARDTNKSYNKIDEFVTKTIRITNLQGDIIHEQENNDQINIQHIANGQYRMEIWYKIAVPAYYKDYIHELTQKNNITLTDRELWILALAPTIGNDGVQRFRESKSQLYYPNYVWIDNIWWDIYHTFFETPFGRGIDYGIVTETDNTTKTIDILFTIKRESN